MTMAGSAWEALHAAGLTATQAARMRGMSVAAAWQWSHRTGRRWPDAVERRRQIESEADRGGPYAEPHVDACRALWAAVLLENWRTARGECTWPNGRGHDGGREVAQRQAAAWFGSEDFDVVCMFVGVDRDAVLAAFRAGMVPPGGGIRRVHRAGDGCEVAA